MFTKLDSDLIDLLCCPLCKGNLSEEEDSFKCEDCSTEYPLKTFSVGDHDEHIFDFRIHHPSYCIPGIVQKWTELQKEYEDLNVEDFLKEIDSVKEIYDEEFHITGKVLDVGGNQGRLRYFLKDDEVPLYVSIDPYWNVFENIQRKPNLLEAYPELNSPSNFLSAHAERLPFKKNSFDWVHMRSVVDHFFDPYIAFKEAYRVLKPNGNLMVGLAIVERIKHQKRNLISMIIDKYKQKGITGIFQSGLKHIGFLSGISPDDDHMFRLKYQDLLELLSLTGFDLQKEHWQKPPFSFCIYLSARKNL